jgi:hypothetical protein
LTALYREDYDFFSEAQILKESKMATQHVASGPVPVVPDKNKNHNKKPTSSLTPKPGKILPTEKINVAKQLDFLRGYGATSADGTKASSVNEVASVLKVAASSVTLASSFLASVGLIVRTDAGTYRSSPEVIAFLRAYEWDKETASHKLGPLLREAWFGKALIPSLKIGPIAEKDAVAKLAEAAPASTEYRKELGMLIDFMIAGGIVVREGNMLRMATRDAKSSEAATVKAEMTANEPTGAIRSNPVSVTTAFNEEPGSMSFNVSFRVDMAEFASWKPERLQAFFRGIAEVLHAKANVEKGGQIS